MWIGVSNHINVDLALYLFWLHIYPFPDKRHAITHTVL